MTFNAQNFAQSFRDESPEDKEIFHKASLMYDFDLKKDFDGYSEADIELLQSEALKKLDGKYTLPDEIRNIIISKKIGIKNVSSELDNLGVKTDFSEALVKNINSPETEYKTFSDSQLFYSQKIADLLPELDTRAIQSELQRRQFFIPFEKITKSFAGREKELQLISDYVDWLPKKGISNKLVGLFRNIIKWHEKPPMLIQGIGGVGKSTLVSKFIIDQNNEKDGKILPFIYIDFDLPGFTLKEPLTILLESIRQLSHQFVSQQPVFDKINQRVSEIIFNKSDKQNLPYQSSDTHSRGFVYDSVENIIIEYGYELKETNKPILIVFDSFEEMQYRASRDELNSFFSFIREISDKIPRLRPIFVGRSEVSERVGDFSFEIVKLNEFDEKSALVLLDKYGIPEIGLRQEIFKVFGGNPLQLQLAADLVKKDPNSIKEFKKIDAKKHQYLVNRILDHIHDSAVRQIAVPGMLVRTITPEIIQEVLAEPCQLDEITLKESIKLFEKLQLETALFTKSSDTDSIAFRQDLRMACEAMILKQYPEPSQKIHDNAITFYARTKDQNEADEAEYYYHRLKRGDIPQEFNKKVYDRIFRYLEPSLIELPTKARQLINNILGSRASIEELNSSSDKERELYFVSQIKRGLNNELEFLHQIYSEINHLPEHSGDPSSEFPYYKALLMQRLNLLNESDQIINKTLPAFTPLNDKFILKYAELELLKIQNLEYQGAYKEAFDHLHSTDSLRSSAIFGKALVNEFAKKGWKGDNIYKKYSLLNNRLAERTLQSRLSFFEIGFDSFSKINNASKDELFVDTFWAFIARTQSSQKIIFKAAKEFTEIQTICRKEINNFRILEAYCQKYLKVFSKDITLSGELTIVLQDFLYVMEIEGRIDELVKNFT